MPIRPELRGLYQTPQWRAGRRIALERAGGKFDERGRYMGGARCEHCRALDRASVLRIHGFGWWRMAGGGGWYTAMGEPVAAIDAALLRRSYPSRVIITVAHLNQISGDDRPENLGALCRGCHLRHDAKAHAAAARITRATHKDGGRPLLQEAV